MRNHSMHHMLQSKHQVQHDQRSLIITQSTWSAWQASTRELGGGKVAHLHFRPQNLQLLIIGPCRCQSTSLLKPPHGMQVDYINSQLKPEICKCSFMANRHATALIVQPFQPLLGNLLESLATKQLLHKLTYSTCPSPPCNNRRTNLRHECSWSSCSFAHGAKVYSWPTRCFKIAAWKFCKHKPWRWKTSPDKEATKQSMWSWHFFLDKWWKFRKSCKKAWKNTNHENLEKMRSRQKNARDRSCSKKMVEAKNVYQIDPWPNKCVPKEGPGWFRFSYWENEGLCLCS